MKSSVPCRITDIDKASCLLFPPSSEMTNFHNSLDDLLSPEYENVAKQIMSEWKEDARRYIFQLSSSLNLDTDKEAKTILNPFSKENKSIVVDDDVSLEDEIRKFEKQAVGHWVKSKLTSL